MNLLDTIRNNPTPGQQGITDETQKLQTLLRAKSGKQLGSTGAAASNLGEQAAVSQTNQQIQNDVVPQIELQNKQLEQQQKGIEQQETNQRADIAQSRKFDNIQTRIRTDQLLNDFSRQKGQIDVQRDGMRLEQLGANLRLQNQKYIDDLQRNGNLARLNTEAGFKEATLRSNLGDAFELLNKQIDNKTILSANDREFKKQLAQIDINTAYSLFNASMAANANQQMWSNVGSLAKAGIAAAGQFSSSNTAQGPTNASANAGLQGTGGTVFAPTQQSQGVNGGFNSGGNSGGMVS